MKNILLGMCMFASCSIFAYNIYDQKSQTYQPPQTYTYRDDWGRLQGSVRPSFDNRGYDLYDNWGRKQGSVRNNDCIGN